MDNELLYAKIEALEGKRPLAHRRSRQGTAVVDRHARHRHGIDRTRQALAEWRRGELQRQVPRRVSEPRMVSFARRGKGSDRRMAATLQRGTSAFEPRLSRAERVRGSRNKASAPPCNGPGRYGIWGLRAPARCSTVPAGTNAASKGGRLKLTVVRRTWAGHLQCRQHATKQSRDKGYLDL